MVLQERFGVSERRACTVVGQPRSTQRLPVPAPSDDELALRAFLRDFSRRRPRWGWRRAARAARDAGWVVNNKRIHRLWRDEGLRVPYRKKKRPLRGIGVAVGAMCPIAPNVLWAMDFQFDQTSDGRTLKLLNVIDEYTRECLAIDIERSIDADGVVRCLDRLAVQRGAPRYVRFDHGPEFIANAVAAWCRFNETNTVFIDPGSQWQNAWVESFNGRLRDEHLNGQWFDSQLVGEVVGSLTVEHALARRFPQGCRIRECHVHLRRIMVRFSQRWANFWGQGQVAAHRSGSPQECDLVHGERVSESVCETAARRPWCETDPRRGKGADTQGGPIGVGSSTSPRSDRDKERTSSSLWATCQVGRNGRRAHRVIASDTPSRRTRSRMLPTSLLPVSVAAATSKDTDGS